MVFLSPQDTCALSIGCVSYRFCNIATSHTLGKLTTVCFNKWWGECRVALCIWFQLVLLLQKYYELINQMYQTQGCFQQVISQMNPTKDGFVPICLLLVLIWYQCTNNLNTVWKILKPWFYFLCIMIRQYGNRKMNTKQAVT